MSDDTGSTNQHFLQAFRQGLREHGYIDGQNLTLEERWAEGHLTPHVFEQILRRTNEPSREVL